MLATYVSVGSNSEVLRRPQERPLLGVKRTKSGVKRTSTLEGPLLKVKPTKYVANGMLKSYKTADTVRTRVTRKLQDRDLTL